MSQEGTAASNLGSSQDLRNLFPQRKVKIKDNKNNDHSDAKTNELKEPPDSLHKSPAPEVVVQNNTATPLGPAGLQNQKGEDFHPSGSGSDNNVPPSVDPPSMNTYTQSAYSPQGQMINKKKETPNEISNESKKLASIPFRCETFVKTQIEDRSDDIDKFCKAYHNKRRQSSNSTVLRCAADLFNLIVTDQDLEIAIRDYWDGESPIESAILEQQRIKFKKLGVPMR